MYSEIRREEEKNIGNIIEKAKRNAELVQKFKNTLLEGLGGKSRRTRGRMCQETKANFCSGFTAEDTVHPSLYCLHSGGHCIPAP